jgi:hypothetical protein
MSSYNAPTPAPKPTDSYKPDPAKPLDGPLARLIDAASADGRGFALEVTRDIAAGPGKDAPVASHVFTVRQELPPHDEWEPPAPYRNHLVYDVPSLVALGRKYSSADAGLVMVDDAGVTLVIDETPERGRRELIKLVWKNSPQYERWSAVVNRSEIDHKGLLRLLLRNQDDLDDATLVDQLRSVKASATVKMNSDLRDMGNSVGVIFESSGSDDMLKFPKVFRVCIPILDDDTEAIDVDIKLETKLPEQQGQGVRFVLTSDQFDEVRRDAIKSRLQNLRDELDGWTVVRGTHKETDRELPGED